MSNDFEPGFEPEVSELEALKSRADQMGIKYHPNISADKLNERIKEHMSSEDQEPTVEAPEEAVVASEPVRHASAAPEGEKPAEKRQRLLKEATRLRRIRITCMNPMKSEWEGEIFTAGNGVVGNIKKYVPFDTEWHVPQILVNMIDERMYQTFQTVRDKRTGQQGRKGKMVKEFAVEMLPDLTEDELKSLAQRQAMARGTAAE